MEKQTAGTLGGGLASVAAAARQRETQLRLFAICNFQFAMIE